MNSSLLMRAPAGAFCHFRKHILYGNPGVSAARFHSRLAGWPRQAGNSAALLQYHHRVPNRQVAHRGVRAAAQQETSTSGRPEPQYPRQPTAASESREPGTWMQRAAGLLGAATLAMSVLLSTPAQAEAFRLPFSSGTQTVPTVLEMKAPKDPETSGLFAEEVENVQLFLRNTPSVVNIANIATRQDRFSMNTMEVPVGSGSGFIWDNKGHVVTNFHVIKGASDIKVALIDQSVYPAKVIGGDPDKDVAVLQLQCPEEKFQELKPITLGTSANLLVGQKVFAIGNPFGLDHTLTQGIVSGVGRELQTPGYRGVPIKNVIQTDAAINPGNSGGVLLDSRGRLVGINTAIADPTGRGASSGVGFAIPIDSVKGLVEQILQYGRVVRPILGITIAPPQALRQIGQEGVLVLEVPSGTPADKAGIRGTYRDQFGQLVLGDVITAINDKPIKLQRDLFETLDDLRPGDRIKLTLFKDGQKRTVEVTLGGREDLPLDQ